MSDDKPNQDKGAEATSATPINVEKGLQVGLDAVGKLFDGFVKAIQGAIGPDMMRNLQAGQWLESVATCLDQTAALMKEADADLSAKAGELSCYLEQLGVEVKGSKVEGQEAILRQRLQGALHALEAGAGAANVKQVSEAGGYFHAAAKSAMPATSGQTQTIKFSN